MRAISASFVIRGKKMTKVVADRTKWQPIKVHSFVNN